MKQNIFKKSGKYTIATVEYMGLYTYSLMRRGSGVVVRGSKKSFVPVYNSIVSSYHHIKNKKFKTGLKQAVSKRFTSIEQKIKQLEDKVIYIETHGITLESETSSEQKKQKKVISSDKKQFLQAILNENKFVMGLQNDKE